MCEYWGAIFQARTEGQRHHHFENILRYVQKAPDAIRWVIDKNEFDELLALKKEAAPGRDGFQYSLHRCAGGLGLLVSLQRIQTCVWRVVLFLRNLPKVRAVFIPKSSDVDNDGRIVRSPDALRPLTLCNFDCKILTTAISRGLRWYTMRCVHSSQRCLSSRQMADNIFEIETTAFAHVACSPRESGILLTDFAAVYILVSIILGSFVFSREPSCLSSPPVSCEGFTAIVPHMWNLQERLGDSSSWPGEVRQGCPASGFLFAMAFDPIFRWLQDAIITRNHGGLDFSTAGPMRVR